MRFPAFFVRPAVARPLAGVLVFALAIAAPAAAVNHRSTLFLGNGIHPAWLWNIPGLSSVDFSFPGQRTVHEIRAFPVLEWYGGWERLEWAFRDNALTTASGSASWAELPMATYSATATGTGGCGGAGSCRIPIDEMFDGEVFVLSGFVFQFLGSNAHSISEIAIRPNPHSGYVDVTFTDASHARPFAASIAYAYYPAEMVSRVGQTFRNSGSAGSTYISGARKVLQGFRVAFDSGDHPIRRFTVDLTAGVRVRLIDQDSAETINWSVDWLELE